MKRWTVLSSAIACLVSACTTSEGPSRAEQWAEKEAAAEESYKTGHGAGLAWVPLVADVPPYTGSPNGWSGFVTDDGAINLGVFDVARDDVDDTIDVQKAHVETLVFTEWIRSEATPDGWVLTYKGYDLDDTGKKVDRYFFEVRRTIG